MPPAALHRIEARLARLEQMRTTSNLPVVVTARREEAAPVVQQPREGFLRGLLRRMAD
jgi:hypothetical protein